MHLFNRIIMWTAAIGCSLIALARSIKMYKVVCAGHKLYGIRAFGKYYRFTID
jgi:hypothetical protein